MIKYRLTWILCAIALIAVSFPISFSFYWHYKVYTEGKLVNVTIKSVPKTGVGRDVFWFEYNGVSNGISAPRGFNRNHYVNEVIQLRNWENYFLLPNDNPIPSGVILTIMIVIGLVSSIYYYINPPR